MDVPNLAGIATDNLVDKIGGSGFQASYINWARTVNLLHVHAPGWMPELVTTDAGAIVHEAPVGAFLLIRFRHTDGTATPACPQAIMDTRNAAIPLAKVTARDITDTHVRGVCKAAAFTFGLAYELWAKLPLESGYAATEASDEVRETPRIAGLKTSPADGAWEGQSEESRAFLLKIAAETAGLIASGDVAAAVDYLESQQLDSDEKIAIWTRFDSKQRSAMKRIHDQRKKAA